MNEMMATLIAWLLVAMVALAIGSVVMLCGYSIHYEEGNGNGKA